MTRAFIHWLTRNVYQANRRDHGRRRAALAPGRTRRRSLEMLERRSLLAANLVLSNGTLFIDGTAADDTAAVVQNGDQVVVGVSDANGQFSRQYQAASVNRIVFVGKEGRDEFTNTTSIVSEAFGGPGDDRLVTGSGADVLVGGAGNDVLVGSEGNDRAWGEDGNDFIMGGPGNDTLNGSAGDDQVFGEEGDDVLYGEAGNDTLQGDDGNDQFQGGDGSDRIYGGAGNDVIFGNAGIDGLSGDAGDDYLNGGDAADALFGGLGNDILDGAADADLLFGNAGNDQLFGGDGNDNLYGGVGDDRLYGQLGRDRLYSGSGADVVNAGGETGDYVNRSTGQNGIEAPPAIAGPTVSQLQQAVGAAAVQWANAGLPLTALPRVQYRVADLPGNTLAWTVGRSDGSSVIWIDANAAGANWFVDRTPLDQREYQAVNAILHVATRGVAARVVDLTTVVAHELGHALGLVHTPWISSMMGTMVPGARILPDPLLAYLAPRKIPGPFLDSVGLSGGAPASLVGSPSTGLPPNFILATVFPFNYPLGMSLVQQTFQPLMNSSQFGNAITAAGGRGLADVMHGTMGFNMASAMNQAQMLGMPFINRDVNLLQGTGLVDGNFMQSLFDGSGGWSYRPSQNDPFFTNPSPMFASAYGGPGGPSLFNFINNLLNY